MTDPRPDPAGCGTLVEMLRSCAAARPDRVALRFLADGEQETACRTYRDLVAAAARVAAGLDGRTRPGDRVLLAFPPGLDFVDAFFGCLWAGRVPVPVPPPSGRTAAKRFRAVADDARPTALLTTIALAGSSAWMASDLPPVLAVDSLPLAAAEPAAADPGAAALLQYSSGSTGDPKGVIVTHRNVLWNQWSIRGAFGHDADTVVVSWLPHTHDMGLIGTILQPLYLGAAGVLLPPSQFARDPGCWLRAVSRFRATTSGGPNSAYDLCADRLSDADKAGLDLSGWRVAFNGAEPVRPRTLRKFAEAFAGCGFRGEAFLPCYGLAEATLLVAAGRVANPDLVGSVSCGPPWGVTVAVVDPTSLREVPAGAEGELWVSGPSVGGGYWGRSDDTRTTFEAETPDRPGATFLRTGDLGFVRGGEVYVTGRRKDLIILNGQNVAPEDIEEAVHAAHPALRPNAAAAFAVPGERGESAALVHEFDPAGGVDPAAVAAAVRRAALENAGVRLGSVVLVRGQTIPRTTSGKVRRAACRDLVGGKGRVVYRRDWGPADDLRELLATVLGADPAAVPSDQPPGRLGLDSLRAVQLAHEIERQWGVRVAAADLLGRETLAALAARLGPGAPQPPAGDVAEAGEEALSVGQQALRLAELQGPGTVVNVIVRAGRLRGPVDEAAFVRAWEAVRDRHPALRMRVTVRDGEARQTAAPEGPAAVEIREAADLPEPLASWVAAEARPFDLAGEDPFRVLLLRRSPTERVLVLIAHHLAVDFWSLATVVREFAAAYEAYRTGADLPPEPPAVPYAEFVRWERSYLSAAGAAEAYWRDRLSGGSAEYHLPYDRPGPAADPARGGVVPLDLDPDLSRRVADLADAASTTPAAVWLTAFAAVLARYADQPEITVGVPFAGRPGPRFDRTVGHFVNTLPVVVDVAADPDTWGSVARTGEALRSALEHQHLPFPVLVERTRSGVRAFQTLFTFQRAARLDAAGLAGWAVGAAGARLQLGPAVLESLPGTDTATPADLDLAVAWVGDRFAGRFKYRADLFDESTVSRVAGHVRNVLAGMAAAPGGLLDRVPVLSADERAELLDAWNRPDPFRTAVRCVHEQWEESARAFPDRAATVAGGRVRTFAEVDRDADRLAAILAGVAADGPLVGVVAAHTPAFLPSILGVLKAGRGFVPLDPSLPDDLLRFQLRDSGVRVVVVAPGERAVLAPRLATLGAAVTVVEVGGDHTGPVWPRPSPDPDGLVYLLYTSGTTGIPKGVPITHRNLMPLMDWQRAEFDLGPEVRLVQTLSYAFDFGIQELLTTCLYGGAVYYHDALRAGDLAGFARFAAEVRATTFYATPSLVDSVLAAGAGFPTARVVLLGGEALTRGTAAAVRAAVPPTCRVYNGYGPTEASINATMYRLPPEGTDPYPAARTVPIGRVSGLNRAYLLDRNAEVVPAGGLGELHIGGPGVGPGYWNRPDRTARAFQPDPFLPGGRVYRTGDRVRSFPGGVYEFRGRLDRQVKLRGHRIELEHVEVVIGSIPGVREAVAVVTGEGAEAALVAYVSHAGPPPAAADLRRYARDRLPLPMVPSRFVVVPDFPRTANGKVDRAALPDPGAAAPDPGAAPPAPGLEAIVASVWGAVLGRVAVGRHDNFFDIGGHSLLLVGVHAKLEQRLGRRFPVTLLFEFPTVSSLSAALSVGGPVPDPGRPPPRRAPRRPRPAYPSERDYPRDD